MIQGAVRRELQPGLHQLLQRHVDQVRRIVLRHSLGPDRLPCQVTGPHCVVAHPDPLTHQRPVLLGRTPRRVDRQRALRQVHGPADELDHHLRHLLQPREAPHPLVGLQHQQQRQLVLMRLRPLSDPLRLLQPWGEEQVQLTRGDQPLEPRIRGPLDRRHLTCPARTDANSGRRRHTSPRKHRRGSPPHKPSNQHLHDRNGLELILGQPFERERAGPSRHGLSTSRTSPLWLLVAPWLDPPNFWNASSDSQTSATNHPVGLGPAAWETRPGTVLSVADHAVRDQRRTRDARTVRSFGLHHERDVRMVRPHSGRHPDEVQRRLLTVDPAHRTDQWDSGRHTQLPPDGAVEVVRDPAQVHCRRTRYNSMCTRRWPWLWPTRTAAGHETHLGGGPRRSALTAFQVQPSANRHSQLSRNSFTSL